MYEMFIADCKREMQLRKMKNGDVARAAGYKTSTINSFFANVKSREKSKTVAEAISNVLNVKI